MNLSWLSIFATCALTSVAQAFVSPNAFVPTAVYPSKSSLPSTLFPLDLDLSTLKNHMAFVTSSSSISLAENPIVSVLSSIFSVIGVFVVISLVLSVIVFAFVVPAAAKELESTARSKYPDLWNEYQAKLEPGEDLTVRPDLIQELGNKIQRLEMEKFDRVADAVQEEEEQGTAGKSTGVIIDVKSEENKD